MSAIGRLFGQSPFSILHRHMEQVIACMEKLQTLFEDWNHQDPLIQEICILEHQADLVKNEIRNTLPKSIFLPMSRISFLEILSLQDALADQAEDVAVVFSFAPLPLYDSVRAPFYEFLQYNFQAFDQVCHILAEMDHLVEASFGGEEAILVANLTEQVAYQEHEADLLQRKVVEALLKVSDEMKPAILYLWLQLVQEVGAIADISEQLADHIRMILEGK